MRPTAAIAADPGSFRDPSGVVFVTDGRVFRTVAASAWPDFEAVHRSGLLQTLVASGRIVATSILSPQDVPKGVLESSPRPSSCVLEHERIPFISYPYEWPFSLLKRAALHHLDLHLDLLESGFTLSDASPYNIQFRGTRPVFIDVLSIKPYKSGEYWLGYRQFCESFLNPLLLTSACGIPFQPWMRGSTEGFRVQHAARILPLRSKMSRRVLLHVIVHGKLIGGASATSASGASAGKSRRIPMTKAAFSWLIRDIRSWIATLEPRGARDTVWAAYTPHTSYTSKEMEAKRAFVIRYVEQHKPVELLDIGCNDGSNSEIALAAGASRVIGLDFDSGALEAAVARADEKRLNLLPLFIDAANPSPDQGWGQRERQGFAARTHSAGLLALAVLHHLVIGRNVPLSYAVQWLVALSSSGVIEFVPKADFQVQRMLLDREDIFPDYHIHAFRDELARHSVILREETVSSSGRILFEYRTR